MYDPVIALNHHVALLTLVELTKIEVANSRGLIQLAAKSAGRDIVAELNKSRDTLRANKMWVADQPVGERRYRYSLAGRGAVHEISETDLEMNMRAIMGDLERALNKR